MPLKHLPGSHQYATRRDGVTWCRRCGADDHQMLLFCPGYRLSEDALTACFTGRVIDFMARKRQLAYGHRKPPRK